MMIKHVILDIDECLVKTFDMPSQVLKDILKCRTLLGIRNSIIVRDYFWSVRRPYLDTFLDFLFNNYETVSVWSAGGYDYVHDVTDAVFRDALRRPDTILTRDDIDFAPNGSYSKPLTTFFDILGRGSDFSNTALIDNRVENFVDNKRNGILVPEFDPECSIQDICKRLRKDDELLKLTQTLSPYKTTENKRYREPKYNT